MPAICLYGCRELDARRCILSFHLLLFGVVQQIVPDLLVPPDLFVNQVSKKVTQYPFAEIYCS